MARIIPGVEVKVVKEVVPKQLAPSGVLGLVGLVEKAPETGGLARASSWNAFKEAFGEGSIHSLPQAPQALANGVFTVVVSPVSAEAASKAGGDMKLASKKMLSFAARAPGSWANGLTLTWGERKGPLGMAAFDMELTDAKGASVESFRNVTMAPGSPRYVVDYINQYSTRITAEVAAGASLPGLPQRQEPRPLQKKSSKHVWAITAKDADGTSDVTLVEVEAKTDKPENLRVAVEPLSGGFKVQVFEEKNGELVLLRREGSNSLGKAVELGKLHAALEMPDLADLWLDDGFLFEPKSPAAGTAPLAGGTDASQDAYNAAIKALENEGDVDMVIAAVQDTSNHTRVQAIYTMVNDHCKVMSDNAKGRLGFGEVPLGADKTQAQSMVDGLRSDRFVLVAPAGTVGAVAGRVGNLSYYESPTFKTLGGVGQPSQLFGMDKQRELLQQNVLPVAVLQGRGLVVVKGITTDGDQISVRRVADRVVRAVEMIGNEFIGRLNTELGRAALRQKIEEDLMQRVRAGALVPKPDGTGSPYLLDVYSHSQDFAMGIVRVDLAMRPVRAIDYIYATVTVQV